jgi:transposase
VREVLRREQRRPSLVPGIYFRLLLVVYFEAIDSERGIAWRAADSFGLRQFLEIGLDEQTPDHSMISRTRRLIDVETHRKVFFWVLERLRDKGAVKGKTVGITVTVARPTGLAQLLFKGATQHYTHAASRLKRGMSFESNRQKLSVKEISWQFL